MWDFARFYSTALMTYKNCPGTCGKTVVPALATAPGAVSDNGLTWTYHLKSGVKFQDGTPVTSQDVKYAVERTFDRGVLPNGPSYFQVLLGGNAATYPGPYKDRSKNLMGLTAVAHAGRDHGRVPPGAPVLGLQLRGRDPADGPGAAGQGHRRELPAAPDVHRPVQVPELPAEQAGVLVPNPQWNASWNPTVSQLPSKIVVNMNMNPNDVDNRLLAGDAQVDFAGTGVQAAARAKILANPTLKAQSDDPVTGFGWFFYIDSQVPPFTNVACRGGRVRGQPPHAAERLRRPGRRR